MISHLFSRSLWSYVRVQRAYSTFLRSRRSQVRKIDFSRKRYLDVGCGPNTNENFVNLEYFWMPGIDLCWDILRGIPLPNGSMRGVFTEHCLEHFSPHDVLFVLRECFRVMEPGATIRVIVPDAGRYLSTYASRINGGAERFPYESHGETDGLRSPMIYVNRIFYTDRDSIAGHRCMYDEALLCEMLTSVGFTLLRREEYGKGRDKELLHDSAHRAVESLYVEASKPV